MANSRVAGDGNTRLRRLGQTLAGPSPDRQPEPPLEDRPPAETRQKPSPVSASPSIVTPPATPPIPQPHQPRLLTATVDGVARTLSLTRWADLLGVDRSTLAYRLNRGWPTREILGLDPRRRDRGAEQAHSAALHARVLVVEDVPDGAGGMVTRVVPRQEAAARLGILPASLTHRLRDYRAPDGSSARVSMQELATRRTPP